MHRTFASQGYIAQRYKRLVSMLMWSCTLSHTEAVSCIRMYLDGCMFASEAVNYAGGTSACLKHAVKCRDSFARMGSTETYAAIKQRAAYYQRTYSAA